MGGETERDGAAVVEGVLAKLEERASSAEYLRRALENALAEQGHLEKAYELLAAKERDRFNTTVANLTEAEQQVEGLRQELESERRKTGDLQQFVDDSLSRLSGLEAQQAELHGSLGSAEARAAEQAARAMKIENELAQERARAAELGRQVKARDAELTEFRESLETCKAAASEAETRAGASAAYVIDLERELTAERVRTAELMLQSSGLAVTLAEEKQRSAEFGRAARQAQVELAHKSALAAELAGELVDERRRSSAMSAELERLEAELRAKEAETSCARKASAEAETELASKRQQLAEAQSRLSRELQRLAQLTDELAQTKAEAEKARSDRAAEAQKAKAEKERLEARLKERFDEIAALTRLVQEKERDALAKAERADKMRLAAAAELGRAVAALIDGRGFPPFLGRRAALVRKAARLRRSGLFDGDWYLRRYRDVADAGMDPALHYVEYGAGEGREPNALFAAIAGERAGEAE